MSDDENIRVLLVEDSDAEAELVRALLSFARRPRFDVSHVTTLADAREALAAEPVDVVLLDLGLPDAQGLEGVAAIRATGSGAAIVVRSSLGDEGVAFAALEGGAQDYILKSATDSEERLARSIRFALARRELAEAAQFFELSRDMMCTATPEGLFVKLNGIWEKTLGWTEAEMVGRPFADFVHPDDRRATAAMFADLAAGETVAEFENRVRTKDDGWRWLEWSGAGVPERKLIYASARDVTARVEAQGAQREAERRFVQAFEEAPTGMALTDLEGRFELVNQALSDITGHGREQLLATCVDSLLEPDRLEAWQQAVNGLMSGELTAQRSDTAYLDATGRPIPVDSSVTLLRGDSGEPQHLLVQAIDISERKRFEGQLQYLADHDALSGMFNRRRFLHELQRESLLADRYDTGGAVLAIDLDNFKYVNDSLGHQIGDELITRTATLIGTRLRATDITGRLGGDEFAAILQRADKAEAIRVARDLLNALRDAGPAASHASVSRVTASIGITMFGSAADVSDTEHHGALTAEELLVEADIALYDAKEAGRDRIAMYDAAKDRHKRMEARLTWADRIRNAIEQESFVLHAQPILGLNGDTEPRHELLIRMVGEEGDLIPPGTFLYIAERFDLIQAIDRWVMGQAIALLAEHKRGGRTLNLQVNLSAKSIAAPEFPAFIAKELQAAGIDGHGLCVEITETAAIVNVDSAKRFAEQLRELGGELALDDFGAGFASFYYLKHLTFDYVKIDGEFIKDLTSSPINQLIVRAIVTIARGIGKRTIAEFVGDETTLKLLERTGVHFAQGFHIGKPAPLSGTRRTLGPVRLPERVSR